MGDDFTPALLVPLREAPWEAQGGWLACPVCSKPWRPWAGSRLQCHARCLYSEADAATIAFADRSGLFKTQIELAARLGISVGVLRAVVRNR